jgi:hypothetical protein
MSVNVEVYIEAGALFRANVAARLKLCGRANRYKGGEAWRRVTARLPLKRHTLFKRYEAHVY